MPRRSIYGSSIHKETQFFKIIIYLVKLIKSYLPVDGSTGWHIILVLTTSAGVPMVAAIKPEHKL
jgi:hypothetical protein